MVCMWFIFFTIGHTPLSAALWGTGGQVLWTEGGVSSLLKLREAIPDSLHTHTFC